jgi:hypothetical protein
MPVAALGRGREADHVARFHLAKDTLELNGGKMVTLINDDLTVPRDQLSDRVSPHEALDHRHIETPGRPALSTSGLADCSRIDAEKESELRQPLLEQRSSVNEDQGAARA